MTTPKMPERHVKPAQFGSWNEHLTAYRKKHPEKSMKECMLEASKTYSRAKARYVGADGAEYQKKPKPSK